MTNVQVASEGEVLTIRLDMTEVAQELTRQVEQWRQTADKTKKHWEESEWYLGEARDSIARLEEQLGSLREVYGQLEARHHETTEHLNELKRLRAEMAENIQTRLAEIERLTSDVRAELRQR
jgi:chromosome segregation ATPase